LPRVFVADDLDSDSSEIPIKEDKDIEDAVISIMECEAFNNLPVEKQNEIKYSEWEERIGLDNTLPEWRQEIKEGMTDKMFGGIFCIKSFEQVFGSLSILLFMRLKIIQDLVELGRQKQS
jgi:hypothetical protein